MRGSVVCRLVSTPIQCPKRTIPHPAAGVERTFRIRRLSPLAARRLPLAARHLPLAARRLPPKSGILAVAPLASGLTVRHLSLEQGIEGSNPSSPANPKILGLCRRLLLAPGCREGHDRSGRPRRGRPLLIDGATGRRSRRPQVVVTTERAGSPSPGARIVRPEARP
jgi:hypothetical protein